MVSPKSSQDHLARLTDKDVVWGFSSLPSSHHMLARTSRSPTSNTAAPCGADGHRHTSPSPILQCTNLAKPHFAKSCPCLLLLLLSSLPCAPNFCCDGCRSLSKVSILHVPCCCCCFHLRMRPDAARPPYLAWPGLAWLASLRPSCCSVVVLVHWGCCSGRLCCGFPQSLQAPLRRTTGGRPA